MWYHASQAARAAATAAALHRLGEPIRVAANEAELALDAPGERVPPFSFASFLIVLFELCFTLPLTNG